jgi:hypothetical protein
MSVNTRDTVPTGRELVADRASRGPSALSIRPRYQTLRPQIPPALALPRPERALTNDGEARPQSIRTGRVTPAQKEHHVAHNRHHYAHSAEQRAADSYPREGYDEPPTGISLA